MSKFVAFVNDYWGDYEIVAVFDTYEQAVEVLGNVTVPVYANVESVVPREFMESAAKGGCVHPRVTWSTDAHIGFVDQWKSTARLKPSRQDGMVFSFREDEFGVRITTWRLADVELVELPDNGLACDGLKAIIGE